MLASYGEHTLKSGQLCLWIIRNTDLDNRFPISQLLSLLAEDEQKMAYHFRRAVDRNRFIVARSLVRLALSQHLPIRPDAWRFDPDHYGRPWIAAPRTTPQLRFSLSHTDGLIACLTSSSVQAAVDVERIEDKGDLALVAERVFSPSELRALHELSCPARTARFFDYWTLKEGYAKARGLGLNLRLSDISFEFKPDNTIQAAFAPALKDNSSSWVFWLDHPSSQHALAVVAERPVQNRCEIVCRSVKFAQNGDDSVSLSECHVRTIAA